MNNVQEISPDKVVELMLEVHSEVVHNGVQANVIKGNNEEYGDFLLVNLPVGDSLIINLS